MVGLAFAIRASPNAVGEEATPPEFTFFEAPVCASGLLQSTCVRSCLETGDRRYLRRSWAEIFSAHGFQNAKRVAYLLLVVGPLATPRMKVSSTSAQRGSPVSGANNIVYWNQKAKFAN
jgi:hypothetical protein